MNNLTPEDHERLNALAEAARQARLTLAEAAKQHRANRLSVSLLRGASEAAAKEYTTAYRAAGLRRQSEWQRVRVSQGLCRLCGRQGIPGGVHCEPCGDSVKESARKPRKKKS